jgi:hypothetical protein
MIQMFSTNFSVMLSPKERELDRWIENHGGIKEVIESDLGCSQMIKYGATLSAGTVGPTGRGEKSKLGAPDDAVVEAKAVADLRKEYGENIQNIIQENLKNYSTRFEVGLHNLRDELGRKIRHEGDRVMKYLKGGPHIRIQDQVSVYIVVELDCNG